jgi:hypothetical protein
LRVKLASELDQERFSLFSLASLTSAEYAYELETHNLFVLVPISVLLRRGHDGLLLQLLEMISLRGHYRNELFEELTIPYCIYASEECFRAL